MFIFPNLCLSLNERRDLTCSRTFQITVRRFITHLLTNIKDGTNSSRCSCREHFKKMNMLSVSRSGCSGGLDHSAEVHGRPAGAQVPHSHQRWKREDPRNDQNLRDAGKEDLQERAAGAAGGGGGEDLYVLYRAALSCAKVKMRFTVNFPTKRTNRNMM